METRKASKLRLEKNLNAASTGRDKVQDVASASINGQDVRPVQGLKEAAVGDRERGSAGESGDREGAADTGRILPKTSIVAKAQQKILERSII